MIQVRYVLAHVTLNALLARDSMLGALCYRPFVCPSVTRADRSKTVEIRIMQFSPYDSPIPLVFADKFHISGICGPRTREGWENKPFSSFKRQHLENGRRYIQSYY